MRLFCVFLSIFLPAYAQLSLPNPPWEPPNASNGAQASNSTSKPNHQWSNLLGDLLYFYDCQRSGNLSAYNRVPWRNSSAVQDGGPGVDLVGGFYDAGDYIKATFPLSFTLMSLCWGGLDSGQGYDTANQTAYLDSILRWGLDWLMKAHSAPSNLYVLVGSTDVDNAYWGGDQNIPQPRPVYAINDTHPGTDAAAGASAAFAACSALYAGRGFNGSYSNPASLRNDSYAAVLATHAEQLYTFAVNATGGQTTYQTSVPAVGDAYASSGYGDDLTIAALFIAWATGGGGYYQDALRYYQKNQLSGQNSVFNWDSKTPGIYVLFAQIAQSGSNSNFGANLTAWQTECERYFDAIVNNNGGAHLTGDGLLYYNGDSDDATLNPALNAAMLMTRYSALASTSSRKSSYNTFAQSQLDYALGKNSMNMPYIVGVNPNSPQNPHSAMASGGDDINAIDTSPPQEAYVIYGAVVGGPDKHDRFYDIRSDWVEGEVALDYNAPMLTLAAMHVMNDMSDPFYTSLQAGAYASVKPSGQPCDDAISAGCGGPKLPRAGIIALAVILSVVGVLLIGLAIWYLRVLRRRRK